MGEETWSLSPNWWLGFPVDIQLPVNLLSTSTFKMVFLKASSSLAIREGREHSCRGTSLAAPSLPGLRQTPAHSGVGLHQSGMKRRHPAHSPPLPLLAPRLCTLTDGHKEIQSPNDLASSLSWALTPVHTGVENINGVPIRDLLSSLGRNIWLWPILWPFWPNLP